VGVGDPSRLPQREQRERANSWGVGIYAPPTPIAHELLQPCRYAGVDAFAGGVAHERFEPEGHTEQRCRGGRAFVDPTHVDEGVGGRLSIGRREGEPSHRASEGAAHLWIDLDRRTLQQCTERRATLGGDVALGQRVGGHLANRRRPVGQQRFDVLNEIGVLETSERPDGGASEEDTIAPGGVDQDGQLATPRRPGVLGGDQAEVGLVESLLTARVGDTARRGKHDGHRRERRHANAMSHRQPPPATHR
jgi:hypothetical protein